MNTTVEECDADDDISGVTTPRELLSLANKSMIFDENNSTSIDNNKEYHNNDNNNIKQGKDVDSDLSDDEGNVDNNSKIKKTKVTIHPDKIVIESTSKSSTSSLIKKRSTSKNNTNNMFTRNAADKTYNISNLDEFQDQLGELKYPKEFNPKRSSVATALSKNAMIKTKKKDKSSTTNNNNTTNSTNKITTTSSGDKDNVKNNKQVVLSSSSSASVTSQGSTQNHVKEINNIIGQKYTRFVTI